MFIIEYDNGEEYEQRDTYIIGVYDEFDKAKDYAISCGFVQGDEDKNFFFRKHNTVIGQCIEHEDFANIYPFELNVSGEHKDIFEHHYK